MKKFLLITDALPQGGAERQLIYLALGLKLRGYIVRLITFYPVKNFYENELNKSGIEEECYSAGKNGIKRALIIKKIVKKWNPNLVIAYKRGTCMAACIAKLMIPFNLVVSERSTNINVSIRDRIRFFLYRWADKIVPNSISQKKFIQTQFPYLMLKTRVITNMIDHEKFKKKGRLSSNYIPQILTTARISPAKNVLNYLDAIKIIKDIGFKFHFNWYGRWDNQDFKRKVKKKIDELEIMDYITFFEPTSDVVNLYNTQELFILPSLIEGFPNVLCEAMACEMPCIASNICDNPYILDDERWLINPMDSIDMANKIIEMIHLSPNEKELIGKKNRERIINLCSESEFIRKYEELI